MATMLGGSGASRATLRIFQFLHAHIVHMDMEPTAARIKFNYLIKLYPGIGRLIS
jgi:hypothetical protein